MVACRTGRPHLHARDRSVVSERDAGVRHPLHLRDPGSARASWDIRRKPSAATTCRCARLMSRPERRSGFTATREANGTRRARISVGGCSCTAGGLCSLAHRRLHGRIRPAVGRQSVARDDSRRSQLNSKTNVSNTPITYMMDGRQYLVFAADDALYAYALPR